MFDAVKYYNIPIFIPHLGCPFQCIFCNQNNIARREKPPTAHEVAVIVDTALSTLPAENRKVEIAFFGGSFTALDSKLQEQYLQAVQPYLIEGKVDGIRLSTRPDFINPDILEMLLGYGVTTIELGVQSLSDDVLKAAGRGHTAEDVYYASELIKQHNIALGIQLMVGLPGDSKDLDMYTTCNTIALHPEMVRIYPVLVINDTPLQKLYERKLYKPLKLTETVDITCNMFLHFQKHGIKVIRMGLHPADELREDGVIVAGPFHPAFGELVEQEAFKRQAEHLINNYIIDNGHNLCGYHLYVRPQDISKMVGNKHSNLLYLNQINDMVHINKIIACSRLCADEIGISKAEYLNPEKVINRIEYLNNVL